MKYLLASLCPSVLWLLMAPSALAVSPVPAPDAPPCSAEQQAQIGKIAADYLLAHPDIVAQINSELQSRRATLKKQAGTGQTVNDAASRPTTP